MVSGLSKQVSLCVISCYLSSNGMWKVAVKRQEAVQCSDLACQASSTVRNLNMAHSIRPLILTDKCVTVFHSK